MDFRLEVAKVLIFPGCSPNHQPVRPASFSMHLSQHLSGSIVRKERLLQASFCASSATSFLDSLSVLSGSLAVHALYFKCMLRIDTQPLVSQVLWLLGVTLTVEETLLLQQGSATAEAASLCDFAHA